MRTGLRQIAAVGHDECERKVIANEAPRLWRSRHAIRGAESTGERPASRAGLRGSGANAIATRHHCVAAG